MYIARHRLRGCGRGLHWGDVMGSWHAMLSQGGGRRGLVRHGVMWRGLGVCWQGGSESVGSGVHAVSGWGGGRWWLGLACRIEAAWQVGGVLRVVLRQHGGLAVAGCCVPYWGGVVAGWWSGCCVPCWGGGGMVSRVMSGRWRQYPATFRPWYCEPCWGGSGGVSRVMSGWHAGAGRLEMTHVLEAAAIACNVQGEWEKKKKKHISNAFGLKPSSSSATFSILRSRGIASHVGAACWGGDKWRWLRWLACTRGRQWPAALKPWGWSAWNNGMVVREESFPGNKSTTHIPTPQIKPPLNTTYHILSHTQTPSLVDVPGPLPLPRAHELPPFVPAPTCRPDMAHNLPRRPNMACKTFDPIYKISHSCTLFVQASHFHPATANPPRRPNMTCKTSTANPPPRRPNTAGNAPPPLTPTPP
ncbi:hypothetical protein EDB86DRAFT_2837895 [Lactarius hatsudake]|nr:hypothetical protein EDB86DRAFT_2837895 [Lactarius hatsudake]